MEYEHFLNSELARLYKNNEIIRGLGLTYETLDTALQQISTNYANIKKAVDWAKKVFRDEMIDYQGLAKIGILILAQSYSI